MSKQTSISKHALENVQNMHGDIKAYLGIHGKKNKKKASNDYYKLVNEEIKRLEYDQKRQDKLDKEELKRRTDEQKRQAKIDKEKIKLEREKLKLERKEYDISTRDHKPVPVVLLKSNKGFSTMNKVKVTSGEILLNPDKKKDKIYTGIVPQILEIDSSIFPGRIARILLPRKFRTRIHYMLSDQPFTRDLFTGEILDPDKKKEVLIERGFIDEEGYYLKKDGTRIEENGCYLKVDVSDIDFIKNEFHALEESKAVTNAGQAMRKTGMNPDKMWLWISIGFIALQAVTIFLLSGGTQGWF